MISPNDFLGGMTNQVVSLCQAMLPPSVDEQIYARLTSLEDPSMVTRLYFCGSLEFPDRLQDILKNGFDSKGEDRSAGVWGTFTPKLEMRGRGVGLQ